MKKILSLFAILLCLCIAFSAAKYFSEDDIVFTLSGGFETVEPEKLMDIGSPYKFYFDTLDNEEKRAYNAILSGIYDMPESIRIPAIDSMQLDDVFWALLCDNPDLFFVGRSCTLVSSVFGTSCSIEYCIERDEYVQLKAELDKACNEAIAAVTNPEDKWLTELEIHDYIIDNCRYLMKKNDYLCSSAYGALVTKEAACEGYSKAAKLLLDRAGVESALLSGTSTGADGSVGAHMWNAVKLNGEYYYLDCTWDDPVSDDGKDVKIYSYFNINNEVISRTHSDFSYDFKCTATAENYHIKTGRYFEGYSRSDEKKLAGIIADELESGGNTVEIRFGTEEAYNTAVKELITNGRIYRVLSEVQKKTDVGISMKSLSYYNDPALLTLTVIPERN